MKRRTLLLLMLFLIATLTINAAYLYMKQKSTQEAIPNNNKDIANNPEEILKKIEEQLNKNQSMHCIVSTKLNDELKTKTELFIKKPKQALIKFLQPNNGVTIGINNKEMWVYFKGDNTLHAVDINQLNGISQSIITDVNTSFKKYIQDYEITAENETADNEIMLIMNAKAEKNNDPQKDTNITIKINKENWGIISETHEKFDGTKITIEYNDINYSDIDDIVFEPPQSAKRSYSPEIFYEFLIQLYAQSGQYETARYFAKKAFENLTEESSKQLYAYTAASLSTRIGDYETALKYFTETEKYPLSETSRDSITYFKGLSLWHLKRFNEAINEFEKLTNKPSTRHYIDSLIAICRIYYENLNNKEKAIQYLDKALKEAPEDRKKEIQELISTYKN
ncbi:MAG: hypothetical protein ACPLRZ_11540 [Thermovenabulum sp.]|uniref:hypothetical protein n=1 Tax=Thermovenabulum sp. TaxID=3100335 RepID=UPI003C7BDEE4